MITPPMSSSSIATAALGCADSGSVDPLRAIASAIAAVPRHKAVLILIRESSTNFRARLIALDRYQQHSELGRLPATAVRPWEIDYRPTGETSQPVATVQKYLALAFSQHKISQHQKRIRAQHEGGFMISVNTFWTILLIIHGLLAVALLGALTHQAMAVLMPVRQAAGNFVDRFRAVPAAGYATAVCVLWVLTFIMGAWIYIKFRIYIRIPIEQAGYWKTQGFFEMKEHAVTIGLGLLPAYWYFWKNARDPQYDSARKWVTVVLAVIIWFGFIVGHVINNVRGFGI
jgi:hypothetical protein